MSEYTERIIGVEEKVYSPTLLMLYFTEMKVSERGSKTRTKKGTMDIQPDSEYMLKFASMKMPFGKYAGRLLIDLPEPYVVWFKQKGFPKGQLGEMLGLLYEIKVNGLEYLFDPLRKRSGK